MAGLHTLAGLVLSPVLPPAAVAVVRGRSKALWVSLSLVALAIGVYVTVAAAGGLLLWMIAALHGVASALLPAKA